MEGRIHEEGSTARGLLALFRQFSWRPLHFPCSYFLRPFPDTPTLPHSLNLQEKQPTHVLPRYIYIHTHVPRRRGEPMEISPASAAASRHHCRRHMHANAAAPRHERRTRTHEHRSSRSSPLIFLRRPSPSPRGALAAPLPIPSASPHRPAASPFLLSPFQTSHSVSPSPLSGGQARSAAVPAAVRRSRFSPSRPDVAAPDPPPRRPRTSPAATRRSGSVFPTTGHASCSIRTHRLPPTPNLISAAHFLLDPARAPVAANLHS